MRRRHGRVGGREGATWSVALLVALIVGGLLAQSTVATAQVPPAAPAPPPQGAADDPAFFAATGYRVDNPAILDYFQRRGGVRTFGYPVSGTFVLQGQRSQLFQRAVLQLQADESVLPMSLLDPRVMPITRLNGSTLPGPNAALLGARPLPGAEDFAARADAFLAEVAPDEWNGLPVAFGSSVRATVSCADLAGTDSSCDDQALAAVAVEVWGFPVSEPAFDPSNTNFVYQRFDRGILQFDRTSGQTQWLLLGDLFKRVLLGADLPPDVRALMAGSRYYAQYNAFVPSGLARPGQLTETSLAGAFRPADLVVAQAAATPTATPTDTPIPTNTPIPTPTATAVVAQPPAAVLGGDVPAPDYCWGSETFFFTPLKPFVGTDITISVSSSQRHDVRYVRLTAPVKPGPVTERQGLHGWVYEWTITPALDGYYEVSFYVDVAKRCITSGFPVLPVFGATPTPTLTPTIVGTVTNTPTPSAPSPAISSLRPPSDPASGASCGEPITIVGDKFGDTQAQYGGLLFFGPRVISPLSWANQQITFQVPTDLTAGTYLIKVVTNGGESSSSYTLRATSCPTATPTVQPAPTTSGINPPSGNCTGAAAGSTVGPGVPTPTPSTGQGITVTGANFGTSPQVQFGGRLASVTTSSQSSVTFTVPSGQGIQPGFQYQVNVVNPQGQTSNPQFYTLTEGC